MPRFLSFGILISLVVINISALSGTRSIAELKGPWDFHPGAHISADSPEWKQDLRHVTLPSSWNNLSWNGKPAGQPEGIGTYRIHLELDPDLGPWGLEWLLAGTAARIWWQDKLIHQAGIPGNNAATEVASNHPAILSLESGSGWLVIQVSNYRHVDGGLWSPMRLAPLDILQFDNQRSSGLEWFLSGAFIILGLLSLGIRPLLKYEKASLWFGLLTLVLGIRILFHGHLGVLQLFPDLDFEWFNKVRYYTMYLLAPLFLRFLEVLISHKFSKPYRLFIVLTSLLGIVLVTLLPYRWFGNLIYFYLPIAILAVILGVRELIRSMTKGNLVLISSISGIIVVIAANLVDMARYLFLVNLPSLVPPAELVMLLLLALSLGLHLARTKTVHEKLDRPFSGIKHSLERFFPMEFLSLFKRESPADVELGHAVSMEMAVLFVDIRSFSTITQDMQPEDIFHMLNSFLGAMGPIIQQHQGFVDKYVGDGIMALFPTGGVAAVDAAIAMHAAIHDLNTSHRSQAIPELSIGVGIHQGPLLLGTIGEAQRMDSTVISSVVNLANRLENLTREYRSPIVVSPTIIMSLLPDSGIEYRFLGYEQIRGFDYPLPIFEIYHPDPPHIREQKNLSKAEFEDALIYFGKGEYKEAAQLLLRVRKRCPDDPAPATYLERIRVIQDKRLLYRLSRQRVEHGETAPDPAVNHQVEAENLFTTETLVEVDQ